MDEVWKDLAASLAADRTVKPRSNGLTMVVDFGLGLYQAEDMLRVSGPYIDQVTLALGTAVLYDRSFLMKKIDLYSKNGIDVMPGESILEIAAWQGGYESFLEKVKDLGFTAVEVSRATIPMKRKTREDIIRKGMKENLKVVTRIGRKHPDEELSLPQVRELIHGDVGMGVFKVAVEAEPSGNGFGLCDMEGNIKKTNVDFLLNGWDGAENIIWDAPLERQQQDFIFHLGVNVNLGNVSHDSVLILEALRRGIIGEKLKRAYLERKYWKTFQEI